jgi:hypothetical protein
VTVHRQLGTQARDELHACVPLGVDDPLVRRVCTRLVYDDAVVIVIEVIAFDRIGVADERRVCCLPLEILCFDRREQLHPGIELVPQLEVLSRAQPRGETDFMLVTVCVDDVDGIGRTAEAPTRTSARWPRPVVRHSMRS